MKSFVSHHFLTISVLHLVMVVKKYLTVGKFLFVSVNKCTAQFELKLHVGDHLLTVSLPTPCNLRH